MPASTTYDINLRYLLKDRATGPAKKIDRSLQQTSRSAGLLSRSLAGIGTGLAAFFGFRAAKEALVDFNSRMEQAKLTTAGLLQLNIGGEFTGRLQQANSVIAELQERAKVSTATTEEFVQFMSEIVEPTTRAGLGVEKLAEFTAQAVVAAKAFGDEQIAAFDIQQALTSQVTIRDRFARKLLSAVKMTREEFNKLKPDERLKTLQTALAAPAIQNLAKAQEQSFAGVFSTLKDNLQILLGKVGMPLFKKLTDEIRRWNTWIDKNGQMLNEVGTQFATTLRDGFEMFKGVIAFFVQNKGILMLIAKMWIGAKLLGAGGRAIGAGIAGITNTIASFREMGSTISGPGGTISKLKGLGGAIGPLSLLIAGMGAAIHQFLTFLGNEQSRRARLNQDLFTSMETAMRNAKQIEREATASPEKARAMVANLRATGLLGATGEFNRQAYVKQLADITTETRKMLGAQLGVQIGGARHAKARRDENTRLAEATALKIARVRKMFPDAFRDKPMTPAKTYAATAAAEADKRGKGKGDVHVTISKIEVASDDPDRFVIGMMTSLADVARNPNAATGAIGER